MHAGQIFSHSQDQGQAVWTLSNMAPRQVDRLRQGQQNRIEVSILRPGESLWPTPGHKEAGISSQMLGNVTTNLVYSDKWAKRKARKPEMTDSPARDYFCLHGIVKRIFMTLFAQNYRNIFRIWCVYTKHLHISAEFWDTLSFMVFIIHFHMSSIS